MPFIHKINLSEGLNCLTKELKIRIVVIGGWGLKNFMEFENNPSIKVVKEAPFEKLFPLVKAVIHHGGAGTTAACLKAGKPFFNCPVLFPISDQQFWGQLACKKGLAVSPVPLKKLTVKILLERVSELLTNNNLYKNSSKLAESLKMENGPMNAVTIIENGHH